MTSGSASADGRQVRISLAGDHYLLGINADGIHLFRREQPDRPIESWPSTGQGPVAAVVRLRQLDTNVRSIEDEHVDADHDPITPDAIWPTTEHQSEIVMACPACGMIAVRSAWQRQPEACEDCAQAELIPADPIVDDQIDRVLQEINRGGYQPPDPISAEPSKAAALTGLAVGLISIPFFVAGHDSPIDSSAHRGWIGGGSAFIVLALLCFGVCGLLVRQLIKAPRSDEARRQWSADRAFEGLRGPYPGALADYVTLQAESEGRLGRRLRPSEALNHLRKRYQRQAEAAAAAQQLQFQQSMALAAFAVMTELHSIERNTRSPDNRWKPHGLR